MNKHQIGLFAGAILFCTISFAPLGLEMPPSARYTLALTVLMAIWWVTEALPLPITALLPLIVLPLTGVASFDETGKGYSDSVIYLFLGGFILALAIEHWNLHKRIALAIITRIGSSLPMLVLGFVVATGGLSMWISNTSTALMMLPIGLAVIQQLDELHQAEFEAERVRFGKALLLGIAYASSIGGIGTLIGTPTNMIFTSFVSKNYAGQEVNFLDWLVFALPATCVMLLACWYYLIRWGFPVRAKLTPSMREMLLEQQRQLGAMSYEEKWVLGIFGTVAACWIGRGFVLDYLNGLGIVIKGLSDTTIALAGAMVLFVIPSRQKPDEMLMTWATAARLPWDIILLFGGGLALASGFDKSGLATWIAGQLSALQGVPLLIVLFAVSLLVLVLTEFASNVATVSMMLPVLASLATTMQIHPYILMISTTCIASAGFMMPMGTAANALVFGTGYLHINDMIRAGFWLDIISVVLFTLYSYWVVGWVFL